MEPARLTGTVAKRTGARVFILEDSQSPDAPEKDLWFISARRFRDSADGWRAKPGDRVSFSPSNMAKRPNPVANDAFIIDPVGGSGGGSGAAEAPRAFVDTLHPAAAPVPAVAVAVASATAAPEGTSAFWRRCPICVGVVATSIGEWEAHLSGEQHGSALLLRAQGITAPPPLGAGSSSAGPMQTSSLPGPALGGGGPMQSRFSFAHQQQMQAQQLGGAGDAAAPGWDKHMASGGSNTAAAAGGSGPSMTAAGGLVDSSRPPLAAALPSAAPASVVPPMSSTAATAFAASGATLPSPATPMSQQLVLPRHSPDDPLRVTVAYRNNFVMEYQWPDVSVPMAVLRRTNDTDVIRRQWLVQRLEVVMGEMDEQLPPTAFQNSAVDWRESFLTRLEMHTGERWTWKKIDTELCLGEGKSSATFWRALRVGIQSSAHAAHANVLVVKPANATQKMLFTKCLPTELPRSWEIPTHGKFIRLSFVRPELVYMHHHRLNNMVALDDHGRETQVTTEVDVPSLMPMWRLDWRSLMAMPEPIFPGAIHVVGSSSEAPRAIEKLVASVSADGLIGLWGEWSGDTKGHEYNRLQVIQLATERCSIVFKVGTWKALPQAALDLFTHPRLRTVALGGQEITKKLRKDFKVDVTGGIDVLDLPAAQRCQPRSLKGLVGVFLQWNVGMDQAGSQWDAPRLTPGQLTHAATRPWLVLVLYRKIAQIDYNPITGVVEGTLVPKA